MHIRSLLRAVLMLPCYEYLLQASLLPAIPPCIIMSSDLPPRRSSRLSNKRTVVPDDGTESVAMTVIKRSGKRSDAGRRHTMTCTFVIDVRRILFDTVSLRHNIWTNSVQCMCDAVCSAVMQVLCVKYIPCTTYTFENKAGQGMRASLSDTSAARSTFLGLIWLHLHLARY